MCIKDWVESHQSQEQNNQQQYWQNVLNNGVTGLIVLNFLCSIVLCQWATIPDNIERAVYLFGDICVGIFLVEVAVRIVWNPHDFFWGTDRAWHWFDLIVTVLSVAAWLPWFINMPASNIAVFRAVRLLRLLRLFARFENIRRLVAAMFNVKANFVWVTAVLAIIISLYAVLGTMLYRDSAPESFGTFSDSFFTLFQLMTLDGWATDEARPLMEKEPLSWIFFVSYITISALIILNVVTGIIIDAMSEASTEHLLKRQRYGRDVDFCLFNQGGIDAHEIEFLRRKAKEYNIKKDEAEKIRRERESYFFDSCEEYRDLAQSFMLDSADINAEQRHLLNCKRRELELDSRVTLKIEQEVRMELYPDHKLSQQQEEFKEFYRALLNAKRKMQTEMGVDDATMRRIRNQLEAEGEEV